MSNNEDVVRAAHLLVKHVGSRNPISRRTNATITLSQDDAMKEILHYQQLINDRVMNHNEDLSTVFAQYAHERSDCSSYRNNGDLGTFTRGQMQQPFEDATYALEIGQMTNNTIVSTDSGYHLIYRIS